MARQIGLTTAGRILEGLQAQFITFGSAGAKVPTRIKKSHPGEERMQPAIRKSQCFAKSEGWGIV
jgi:hypothetical protein